MAPRSFSMLDDALDLLASSTVTDRNKGIDHLSDLVANRSHLESIKDSRWAEIFHQLFSVAETEKSALLNQSTARKRPVSKAANVNRLQAVTALIRKFVSGFVSLFKHKAMKLVVNRTLELMVSSGRTLLDTIVLDCIRILRDFLSYRPHLEHLNPRASSEILAICFASILDKKLPKYFMLPNNVDFLQAKDYQSKSNPPSTANPRTIDSSHLLSMVISASPSVCLESSKYLLFEFLQVFQRFPKETSAHFHLINALHALLRELELNKGIDLSQSATDLGHCLINLFSTKNSSLKEQVIICLTYLLPFVIREAGAEEDQGSEQQSLNAESLLKKVLSATSSLTEFHPKISSIPLNTLRLIIPPREDVSFFNTKAFSLANFNGADPTSERVQLTIWAALRLGASALNHVSHSTYRFSERTIQTPSKRRKVEDEFDIFFEGLKPRSSPPLIIHRLQLLIITVDLYWKNLDYRVHFQINESILQLMNSNEPSVLDWVFVLLGTMAHCIQPAKDISHSPPNQRDSIASSSQNWQQIWASVIHRTTNPTCCRSASYAAFCILATHRIPAHAAQKDIYGFLQHLHVHSPPFPYDSICMLVSECLAIAADNLQLSTYALEQKVLLWLTKSWPEVNSSAAIGSLSEGFLQRNRQPLPVGFDSEAILLLFTSITKLPNIYLYNPLSLLPDCASTDTFVYLEATQSARSSIFPCLESNTTELGVKPLSQPNQVPNPSSVPQPTPYHSNLKQEISNMLHQSMKKMLEEIEPGHDNPEQLFSALSCAHAQMIVKLLIVTLMFQASCQAAMNLVDQESIKLIASYFEVIIPLVELSKWTPFERSTILTCFGPILLHPPNNNQKIQHAGLASPGAASGVASDHRFRSQPKGFSNTQYECFVSQVWSANAALRSKFEAFSTMCERLLQAMPSLDPTATLGNSNEAHLTQTQITGTTISFEEDVVDGVVSQPHQTSHQAYKKKTIRSGLGSVGNDRATMAVSCICIQTLVTSIKTCRNLEQPAVSQFIASILSSCSGLELVCIGSPVLDCILGSLATLTADQAENLLQNLGKNYLETYAYSQNVNIRIYALRLIQITLSFWNNSAVDMNENVETMARQLCTYFITQMISGNSRSWEVNKQLSILLDACVLWDPLQRDWTPLELPESPEPVSSCPSDLMLRFLQDQDYRVRHGAVLFTSRVFDLLHATPFDPVQYWQKVIDHLCIESTELEVMLTNSLCITNVFIVSEAIRPRSYLMLLDFLIKPQDLPEQIIHHKLACGLLQRAAHQLGFTSIAELYKVYAGHVAFERHGSDETFLQVNEKFVGKLDDTQKVEIIRVHLLCVGYRFYLNNQLTGFQTCAQLAGYSEIVALQLCSPAIAAELVARACTQVASMDSSPSIDRFVQPTLKTVAEFLKLRVDVMQTMSDRVILYLMCCVHVTPEDINIISKVVISDPAQRNAFEVLSSKLRKYSFCEPALPFYPILRIAQGMKWLGERYQVFSEPGLIYNIICHTFAALIGRFTSDRLRFLYSLSIFISFSHLAISSSLPILSLLLQGLISLLSHSDILQFICPFLRWTVGKILQPSNSDLKDHASMVHLMIALVQQMKQIADSSSSELNISSAKEFNGWLLKHIEKTNNMGQFDYQNLCHSVLLHWPEKHSISVDEYAIKSVLTRSSGPSLKLIHHLRDPQLLRNTEETGKILYNLLLSAQGLNTEIEFEDCQRYLELLYLNSGILTSPRLGHSSQTYQKTSFEEYSLKNEDEALSQIFAIVISRLQISTFQQMLSLTTFLQAASGFENIQDFYNAASLVRPLEFERATLTCPSSIGFRPRFDFQSSKPEYKLDFFASLDQWAHSAEQWTRGFLHILIASRAEARPLYTQLFSLTETNDELAAEFLPRVLYSCLLAEIDSEEKVIRTKVSGHISTILTSSSTNSVVITRIINLLTYLRYHERPGTDPLGRDKWLDVSWIHVAEQATHRGMPTWGFLFLEIAREHGLCVDLSKQMDPTLQSYLESLFSCSPEPDAFYSLITSDPRNFLLHRYRHERQWESAFGFHGAVLEGLSTQSDTFAEKIPSIAGYLSACGLNRLAHAVLHASVSSQDFSNAAYTSETQDSSTLPFELAWRASVWDLPVATHLDSDSSTRIYGSLRSCHCDREKKVQLDVAKKALVGQFKELIQATADRVQPTPQAIGSALALRDIVIWLDNKQDTQSLASLPSDFEYEVLERISAVRRSLLQVVGSKQTVLTGEKMKWSLRAREAESKLRIETSQAARHCGNLQSAMNIIAPIFELIDDEKGDTTIKAKEEFAKVLWAKGEKTIALSTLKTVYASETTLPQSALQLCTIGEWISVGRLNSAQDIIDSYFEKAIQSLNRSEHPDAFGQVSYIYAKLADAEYHKLRGSEEIKKLSMSTKRLRAEIDATSKLVKSNPSAEKVVRQKTELYEEDLAQLESLSELQSRYLSSSLEMYLACLAHCDRHDDAIFRIVSLWLDHSSDPSVNKLLHTHLCSVPTHKFLRVSHQLAARLSNEPGSAFQKILSQLIVNLCKDHPFHIIFQILLLQRGIKSAGLDDLNSSRSRRVSQTTNPASNLTSSEFSRAQAASNILVQLAQIESRKEVVNQLILLHKAYKEWAMFDVPNPGKGCKPMNQIPTKMLLRNVKDLSVPVPTVRIPIDKTCRYITDSMPCIRSYDWTFKLASGLHRPKITSCLASNGMSYLQLFKGGDDVCQDAIMEQVFELVNEFLQRDTECQKRTLNFKTYNVIPLSPDAGVIEFVMNTLSLAEILIPMHRKYNEPQDWNVQKLRHHLDVKGNAEARIKRYKELLPHCRPAMRFWFFETQKCPQKWYEMRLNFARSAATTSIVGHILGLGDRHLSNILIDKKTGEVVQIDLGIAFDDGKRLRIPETVPFRLTRDMVDGFGVAKTEGVFRRCCELTLRVMRENKTLLMTIMDVLQHDLLRSWIVTAQEEKLMQGVRDNLDNNKVGDDENRLDQSNAPVSERASRALAVVENRLSGDHLSVETTVNQLIQEATSVENLGALYSGWSAFY